MTVGEASLTMFWERWRRSERDGERGLRGLRGWSVQRRLVQVINEDRELSWPLGSEASLTNI